jgi:hypothetical protein
VGTGLAWPQPPEFLTELVEGHAPKVTNGTDTLPLKERLRGC